MKITVDRTKCEGYAKCVQAAPKVFKLDSKMTAEVLDPRADTDEKIILAAKICPTKAITVEEEGTGKKIFPTEGQTRLRPRCYSSHCCPLPRACCLPVSKAALIKVCHNPFGVAGHGTASESPSTGQLRGGSPVHRNLLRVCRQCRGCAAFRPGSRSLPRPDISETAVWSGRKCR